MTVWMFQANPKRYDLLGAARSGFDDNWAMNQHRSEVTVGDKVYFFISGSEAGIYLVGRVVSPVYESNSAEADAFGRWTVDVEYESRVEPPLLRPELLDPVREPVLADYLPFKGRQATNFIVPPDVAVRLAEITEGRLAPIPKQPGKGFDKTAHAVDVAIKEHDAAVARADADDAEGDGPGRLRGPHPAAAGAARLRGCRGPWQDRRWLASMSTRSSGSMA